jgi:hypothetical protein
VITLPSSTSNPPLSPQRTLVIAFSVLPDTKLISSPGP